MDKKKGKPVRAVLYKVHDYDLVAYAWSLKDRSLGNAKISLHSVVRGLLNQYVKGEPFKAPRIKRFTNKSLPSKITLKYMLDPEDDKELIELFDGIKPRQRNSFIKSLLRRNLNEDGLSCYFLEDFDSSKYHSHETSETVDLKKAKPQKDKSEKPVKTEVKVEKVITKAASHSEPVQTASESSFDLFGALGNINI